MISRILSGLIISTDQQCFGQTDVRRKTMEMMILTEEL